LRSIESSRCGLLLIELSSIGDNKRAVEMLYWIVGNHFSDNATPAAR